MKQPFSYYGGKQNMFSEIIPLIPNHTQYVEAFVGGGTLFWGKNPSKNEVINDFDARITNFYMQLKTNFDELQKMISGTLHSEVLHQEAKKVLDDVNETPLRRAWALWVQTNMSFSFIINGGYAFGTTGMGYGTANKRDRFTDKLAQRLRDVEIFNRDALDLIKLKDHPETLFYLDPPYASSDCGHYKGYTLEDFTKLLEMLKNIKGKFILSSYPEDVLLKYREECGWHSKDIKQIVNVSGKREGTKYKTECITFNFTPPNNQAGLFDTESDVEKEDEDDDEDEGGMELIDAVADYRKSHSEKSNAPIFTEEEINEGKEL